MTHLWVRSEERANERRVGLTPSGAADLAAAGFTVTVEDSPDRIIPTDRYRAAGVQIAEAGSWRNAPADAIIFGLKELPDDTGPLTHRHILFGHAFKGQPTGRHLLDRFKAGGGTLLDLEYLVDGTGRRVAAFGYWAGYVGAGLSVAAWAAQRNGRPMPPVSDWPNKTALIDHLIDLLRSSGTARPNALIIGALGRTGSGAAALLEEVGLRFTSWDMAETAHGGPFPEILTHDIFLNCILATQGVPVFIPEDAKTTSRHLSVIGDIACDPESDFSPIKVYDRVTTWAEPVVRVADDPPLDVMAIDNLPSLLPLESSEDYAAQLLASLCDLPADASGVWARAEATFRKAL